MQKRNLTVGIFLVAGVALFTLGLFLIGSQHKVFARHFEVYAEFADIHGLTKGGKVRVAGLDAGEVVDIAVPRSPTAKFRLRLRLEEGVHAIVRADSTVTIATEGVVGDKFLLIHAGSTQAAEAASGATLPSKEPLDMADLMEKSAGLLSGAGGAMKTTGQKLNETLDTANMTMRNANDLIVGLKQGKGTAGMLLHDETTATRIRQSIENVHQATASLTGGLTAWFPTCNLASSARRPRRRYPAHGPPRRISMRLRNGSGKPLMMLSAQTIEVSIQPQTSGNRSPISIKPHRIWRTTWRR
jgi:phospholipid/cholesterol/gamma-HCH transport system substrate-binding protein